MSTHFAQRRPGWEMAKLDANLQLDSFEPLEKASAAGRQNCPQCGKSRRFYCYNCLVPLTATPSLELPFQLHIITHSAEAPQKATGIHAAVLCPDQVQLCSVEQLPQLEPSGSVVMFPSDDALLPHEVDLQQLKHVIIIDSKWRKAKELNGHPAFDGMKRVKLPGNPRSSFWRFHTQGTSEEGVCTIEALHLLMQAFADQLPQQKSYWDNLLWYYAFQHKVVEKAAAERLARRQEQEQEQKARSKQQQQPDVPAAQAPPEEQQELLAHHSEAMQQQHDQQQQQEPELQRQQDEQSGQDLQREERQQHQTGCLPGLEGPAEGRDVNQEQRQLDAEAAAGVQEGQTAKRQKVAA